MDVPLRQRKMKRQPENGIYGPLGHVAEGSRSRGPSCSESADQILKCPAQSEEVHRRIGRDVV